MAATATTKAPVYHRGSTSRDLRRTREAAADDAARWARDRGDYVGRRSGELAAMATDRDLTTVELFRARRNSRRNYKTSGIFGAMVDQAVCHVIGDGVSIQFEDEDVGDYVLGVLNHPRNAFLETVDETFRRWIVDGEGVLTLRALTRNGTTPTGDVYLGLKDPNEIGGFQFDAWNDQLVTALRLPTPRPPDGATPPPDYPTSAWVPVGSPEPPIDDPEGDDVLPPGWPVPRWTPDGKLVTDAGPGSSLLWVHYLRLNALGARGVPLFSRSVDKVTMLDLLVDHLMAKAEYTNRHWVHVTYKQKDAGGKSDKAFEKKMLKWATEAQPGEAACTSDDVKVNVLAPDLKLIDQKALYEIGVGYILGSHSMPRVWFGESAGERSGAAEAGSPIYRLLKWLQSRFRRVIDDVVRFLFAIGRASGKIAADADDGYTVAMAEFATRDSVREMQELSWGEQALDSALASGAITRLEHQRMVRKMLASKPFGSELEDDPPPLPDPQNPELAHAGDLPLHRDGTGAQEPDPDAKAPMPGEQPGASGSPPSPVAPSATAGGGPAAPAAPGSTTPAAGAGAPASTTDVQKTALNGAQIAAVVDVASQVTAGTLGGDAAKAILALAFPGYDLDQIASAIDAAVAEGEKQKAQREKLAQKLADNPPPPPPGQGAGGAPPPSKPPPPPPKA